MENLIHQDSLLNVDSKKIKELFDQNNEHRDYSIYNHLMRAATEAKVQSIAPYMGEIGEGSVIVDAGSGTGDVAEEMARQFRGAKVYGLDISHELLETAEADRSLVHLKYGNLVEQNFPDNSVDVKYFGTVGHEVASDGGLEAMDQAMSVANREIAPEGKVIVRDFCKPSRTEDVYMRLDSTVGLPIVPEGVTDEEIDYSLLSANALFNRFHQEFQGGGAFQYERVTIDGQEFIKLSPEWAAEFYLRKDYTANWRQEIKEKYLYWTQEEAEKALKKAGFEDVEVAADMNQWIFENRLKDKVELFELVGNSLQEIEIPPTHMVACGKKPKDGEKQLVEIEEVDYDKALDSITFEENEDEISEVKIGERSFQVLPNPIVGDKKLVFRLKDDPSRVLKVVRHDVVNKHNAFKTMFEIIGREGVMDDHGVEYLKTLDFDPDGPPYRYIVQEAAPEGAINAADLLLAGDLEENDIRQMAEIVKKFEHSKQWQLDTNPFGWFRVMKEDGTRKMVYAAGKVYRYDENWAFNKVGLLQWMKKGYVMLGKDSMAALPKARDCEELAACWKSETGDYEYLKWWKKYLAEDLTPSEEV